METGSCKAIAMDGNDDDNIKGAMHQGEAFCSPICLTQNQEKRYQKQHQSTKEEVFPLLSNDKEELKNAALSGKQI